MERVSLADSATETAKITGRDAMGKWRSRQSPQKVVHRVGEGKEGSEGCEALAKSLDGACMEELGDDADGKETPTVDRKQSGG